MKLVDRRLFIDAPPARVYELLTDEALLVEWMAPVADLDASPGGSLTWSHLNGDSVMGAFVELVPGRRIVFTYGWEREDVGIPPGSTTVEIDLVPKDGGTDLRLVHRGLAGPMADAHDGGWRNYLSRLAAVAEGRDPGPDPLAAGAVPGAAENRGDVTERQPTPGERRFWRLAEPLLEQAGVTRSTMMGFPCLRLDGDFFASCDHRTGNLVVKLDESRVSELVEKGTAEAFAPSGRPFREWASIPVRRQRSWARLLDDALQCAASRRTGARPSRRSKR